MLFYKLLLQLDNSQKSIVNFITKRNISCITGKYNGSFAIDYDPEKYASLLNDDTYFIQLQRKSVQQLIVTNQKFLAIVNESPRLNLILKSYELSDSYASDSGLAMDDLSTEEKLQFVTSRYNARIKKITFYTKKGSRKFAIQKNGVIEFDKEIITLDKKLITKIIDTLNIGLKVIEK